MHLLRGIDELEELSLGAAPHASHSRHKKPGQTRNASGQAR